MREAFIRQVGRLLFMGLGMETLGESHEPFPEDPEGMGELVDDAIPGRGDQTLPVAGLGGSAGSLAAGLTACGCRYSNEDL